MDAFTPLVWHPVVVARFRSVVLFLLYLAGHVLLFSFRPKHYAVMEIGLQMLVLLPAMLAGLKSRPAGAAPEEVPRIPWWILMGCMLVFVLGGLVANRPLTEGRLYGGDESAYRFQASIFASGHVTAPAPPAPVFFEHHIITGGRWFTKFPPGWPAILALAAAAGLPSAANVLLGALLLWIVFCAARQVYSDREARLALFLMLFSPLFAGNCLGQMSHPLCGCLLAAATFFYFRARRGGGWWNVAAMLSGVGAATLVRPLSGALFGLILGVAILWQARRDRARLAAALALCGLFAVLTVCANGAYNKATTGDYALFPYAMIEGGRVPAEVQPDLSAMARNLRWGPMTAWVFAFPLLIPAAGFTLWQDREKRAEAMLLAALFLCLVAGYASNKYSSGSFTGERFYFEGFFALPLLGARGLSLGLARRAGAARMARYLGPLAAGSAATLVLTLPLMYREAAPYAAVRVLAERLTLRAAVVFLEPHEPEFLAKHFNLNTAGWPAAPAFFAPDPGPDSRQALVQAFGRSNSAVISYDPAVGAARLSDVSPPPDR